MKSPETTPQKHQPNPQGPTPEQLSAARLAKWHQNASPLLTIEDLRSWLNASGLILYTSRAQQLPAPAPSLVEATLGAANTEPSLEETASTRSLLARLIAEGVAVPLNLLGVTGASGTDTPDFVVSAAVFSYIFTLRGNKAWKQPPVTAGPVKVSPLALAAYEILSQKVTLSVYDLTTQLGKEVTEAAVLRSLTELWSQLRVIPVPQQDGSPTLWELSTARFTKQIKAGANAGQPSALSALISLYLGQAIAATEEEIETFLSPLAPRSRVRDVIHALLAARHLETFVVEGKTLLHVAGDLPAFAASQVESSGVNADLRGEIEAGAQDGSRIRKFTPKPGSKIGTGLRAKPAFGSKPAYGSKTGGPATGDRERRPFQREDTRSARPAFNKPWEEDKAAREPRRDPAPEQGSEAPRAFTPRPARPNGVRPSTGRGGPGSFAGKSRFEGASGRDRESGPRKTFSKPGTFGRKREGSAGKAAFERSDSRSPSRSFEGKPARPSTFDGADRPEAGGFKRPGSYSPRPAFGGGKPSFGSKPAFGGPRPERRDRGSREGRPALGGFSSPKPFRPSEGGERPGVGVKRSFGSKPAYGSGKPGFSRERGEQAGGDGTPRKVFRKFDALRSPRPSGGKPSFGAKPYNAERSSTPDRVSRPYSPRTGSDRPSSGARPGGKSFGAKRPSAFAGKGGPFAKFGDGKKPFRKPGPGKPGTAGFSPTRRKRPEEAE